MHCFESSAVRPVAAVPIWNLLRRNYCAGHPTVVVAKALALAFTLCIFNRVCLISVSCRTELIVVPNFDPDRSRSRFRNVTSLRSSLSRFFASVFLFNRPWFRFSQIPKTRAFLNVDRWKRTEEVGWLSGDVQRVRNKATRQPQNGGSQWRFLINVTWF